MKSKIFNVLGVGLVLALVLSLAPLAGLVGAQSNYAGFILQIVQGTSVNGTASWVVDTHSGNYAVKLETGDPPTSQVTGTGRIVLPYNQALSTITDLGYSYKLTDGNGSPNWDSGPYIVLDLDNDGDGTADSWVVHHMFADSPGTGTWLRWELGDDPLDSSVMVTGNHTAMWHIAGDNSTANIDWADIVSAHGDYTVLNIKVALGEWTSDINTAHYVDDITINGTTYDLEPMVLDKAYYKTGNTVSVTVYNGDVSANTDPMAIDTVTVAAKSTTDTIGDLTVTLTETGSNTGVFTGSVTLIGAAPANRANNEVVVSTGDTVTVTYNGNWGAGAQTVTTTATVDDTKPVITIVSPTASSNITDPKPEIKATYTDGSGSGVDNATAVMKVDGSAVTANVTTATSITYWPSTNLAEGSHTVTVDVSDVAGNAATQKSWSFTVDTVKPVITDQVATPDVVPPSVSSNITFTANVTDATSGVKTVTCNLSSIGGSATQAMLAGGGIYTANYTANVTTEGTYTLLVTALDNAGNSASANITLGVWSDLIPPVITSPAITYLYGTSARPGDNVTISANVTDDVLMGTVSAACTAFTATVNMTADGDIYTGTPTVKSGAANGNYTVTITAKDAKGNEATDNTSLTLTVHSTHTGWDIELFKDWNLISLPLVPTDGSIDIILAGISDNVTQVRTWVYEDGVLTEKVWINGGPAGFTTMVDGRGYWIEMTAANTLTVTGTELPAPPQTPPSYSVYAGWNLIGFKSLSVSTTAQTYLGTAVSAKFERMYGYDAAAVVYTVIELDTPVLQPGQGYWLAVSAAGTIYP